MLGFEKIFHQPVESKLPAGRIDTTNRPIVGTSHSRPTAARNRCTGVLPRTRRIFVATLSWSTGASSSAPTAAIGLHLPLEAAHVQCEHRQDEHEQEDGDRRTDAE